MIHIVVGKIFEKVNGKMMFTENPQETFRLTWDKIQGFTRPNKVVPQLLSPSTHSITVSLPHGTRAR
jgi:hypothetical protein